MEQITNYQEHVDNAIQWFWDALPNLLIAILLLVVGTYVIRVINKLIRKFFAKKDYDESLESFLQSLISIALKILLFVLVITQLGVQSSSLVAIIGAAGLAIGLALQGSLANFAGGVLILLFKPFKVGDYITAQGESGTVEEISIFTTTLKTPDNKVVIIPNGPLANGNMTNYSSKETRRVDFTFGIAYDADIKKAKKLIMD